jgi:hypothetical protein
MNLGEPDLELGKMEELGKMNGARGRHEDQRMEADAANDTVDGGGGSRH